jgi:hypothetical protein
MDPTTHIDPSLIDILDLGEEILEKAKTVGGTIQQQVSRVLEEDGPTAEHAGAPAASGESDA